MNNVRHYRKEMGMPQRILANLIGITRPYLSDIERGVKKPSVYVAIKISQALGISVEKLFSTEEAEAYNEPTTYTAIEAASPK